uniref:Chromatin modification-related protein MEAF6 n=1 Tax=Cyclophora tenuis TaxID=216820 RepID=A0A7S1GMH7_CYCTE
MCQTMDFLDDDCHHPSGLALPRILKRKLISQLSTAEAKVETERPLEALKTTKRQRNDAMNVFTGEELEGYLMRASLAVVEIQKQLYKGEEVYHEGTNAHGNLFRGWDAFVDLKDIGIGAGNSSIHLTSGSSGTRRMPTDQRWFSGSCRSVMKNSRPVPIYLPTSRTASASTTPIPRSQAPTPVSRVASPAPKIETAEPVKPTLAAREPVSLPRIPPKHGSIPKVSTPPVAMATKIHNKLDVKPSNVKPEQQVPIKKTDDKK